MRIAPVLRACLAVALTAASASLSATVFTVTNTADTGAGSLRQALTDANAAAGPHTINFSIAGAGVHTITPASAAAHDHHRRRPHDRRHVAAGLHRHAADRDPRHGADEQLPQHHCHARHGEGAHRQRLLHRDQQHERRIAAPDRLLHRHRRSRHGGGAERHRRQPDQRRRRGREPDRRIHRGGAQRHRRELERTGSSIGVRHVGDDPGQLHRRGCHGSRAAHRPASASTCENGNGLVVGGSARGTGQRDLRRPPSARPSRSSPATTPWSRETASEPTPPAPRPFGTSAASRSISRAASRSAARPREPATSSPETTPVSN